MTQQMLILFAIFVERSQLIGESQTVKSSQQAMAVFSFFLFLIYAAFGLMLVVFRDDVIKDETIDSNNMGEGQHQQYDEQEGNNQYDEEGNEEQ
eukprot:CAMPEP_0170074476 /NCGR_PEP_ID=MMETSP0019_2-20121128/11773_1 /TAXON_ID=98059 /ORGANISM="Dinobryon sp., Strain UTEXLB2267" /LENGTH=93 /DNA_ID=CAMNT_0010284803 /DNA_START=329 /DNA_END=610 /DNA_ORIENTATION=+